jgi:hypothetical protein
LACLPATPSQTIFFYFERNDASDATVFDAIMFDGREGSFSEYNFFGIHLWLLF